MTATIVAEESATGIPAGEWEIDPVWSALEFEVRKLGLVSIKGRVPGFTGSIVGGEKPALAGTVDATSITTFDETRDAHISVARLLRHAALSGAPLRVDLARDRR